MAGLPSPRSASTSTLSPSPSPSPSASLRTTSAPPSPAAPTIAAAKAPDAILAAGSCQPVQMHDEACVTRRIASWRGIPFTPTISCSFSDNPCQILMDVYAPTDAGPWPLVVVVPGGGIPPDQIVGYADDFALAIADRGAVVMTSNWRQSPSFGADSSQSLADVACAVGVARATGPAYGADAARVVLIGHSSSVWPVWITGLTPSPIVDPASCNSTSGSLRPDAIEVVAGLFVPEAVDLAESDEASEHIPVVIAQGGKDDPARVAAAPSFQALLIANGWDSRLIEIATADHPTILSEPDVIDAVMELAKAP